MRRPLPQVPFFVVLMGIAAAAMYVPAVHALVTGDTALARLFAFTASLALVVTALLGLATQRAGHEGTARGHLLALCGAFAVLPLMLAVPLYEAAPAAGFFDAWVEMVSSATTTGATLYPAESLAPSLHLWRALVGWMGGFLVWVTAIAVLAPLNLGGFEVTSAATAGRPQRGLVGPAGMGSPAERLARYAADLAPVYAGLTLALWLVLTALGEAPLQGACAAMSTLATSGIVPGDAPAGAGSGRAGEVAVLLFLVFALSRQTFTLDFQPESVRGLTTDPELRFGLSMLAVVPVFLFLRHWAGALETQTMPDPAAGLRALWGGVFTAASFLTTTGFASADWQAASGWSGLETPGLILLGLALVGGGVATTAGGVKLLRVYALAKHGSREIEKLIQPHSVGGSGAQARRIRTRGAFIAWIFFMLFALSVAAVMLALALAGVAFEPAAILAVAALSTTGPLAEIAGEAPIHYGALDTGARAVIAAAMILGRMETLALIALFNPEFWRN